VPLPRQKLCFGGKVDGQSYGTATTSPPRLNLLRIEEDLSLAHLRLARVNIENLHWADCIKKYDRPSTFFYMDPPYWGTAGYGVAFGLEQYELMAELMATIKGQAIVSVNDHPEMRRVFSGMKCKTVSIIYTVGGSKAKKPAKELIVRNFS